MIKRVNYELCRNNYKSNMDIPHICATNIRSDRDNY